MTTPTDWRALCAELADALDEWQLGGGPPEDTADADLMARARTALAQPEPEGPTDEEAWNLADDLGIIRGHAEHECGLHVSCADLALFAQSALTHYARPTIKPVPVAERLPDAEDCDAEGRCWWWIVDQPGELPHWIYCQLEVLSWTNFTAWLPHHALPVPQP